MMNAAAPITGGISWPLTDAAHSIAPAFTAGMPTRFINERDRERADGDHVGGRGTRDHAVEHAADDRGLGRPAAEIAQRAVRQRDEVATGAGAVEQGAEQHEQEDEGRRDLDRRAPDAFGADVELLHDLRPRVAVVQVEHVGRRQVDEAGRADRGVADHQRGDRRQRPADHAQRGQREHGQQHAADDDVARIRHAALQRGQRLVVPGDVAGREHAEQRQRPVGPWNRRAPASPAWKSQEAQRKAEGQMDRREDLRVQPAIGDRPQLECAPAQREREQQRAQRTRARLPSARFIFQHLRGVRGIGCRCVGGGRRRGGWRAHAGFSARAATRAPRRRPSGRTPRLPRAAGSASPRPRAQA